MKSSLLLASLALALTATVLPARAETAAAAPVLSVANAGDYVHVGSFRIWVESHLGQPDHRLADGTWLYANRQVTDGSATGTLVVTFHNGRVSDLKLISPAMTVAMLRRNAPARVAAR